MLTLYDYLPSQNAWKVRQLLQHLQRPYRTQLVSIFEGEGRREDYQAINPTGTVPAIRLDDGRVLAESNAILMFLAEGTPYLPDDAFGRAKVWQWLSFEQERVESQIGALRHWTLTGKLPRRPEVLVEMKRSRRTEGAEAARCRTGHARLHRRRELHHRRHRGVCLCQSRGRGRAVIAAVSALSRLGGARRSAAGVPGRDASVLDRSAFGRGIGVGRVLARRFEFAGNPSAG